MLDANESQELMGAIQQVATGSGRSAADLPAGIVEMLITEHLYQSGVMERPESGEPGPMDFDSQLQQVSAQYGVAPADIDLLIDTITQDGNYSMYLKANGNPRAIAAAKALGYTIPSTFMDPSVSVTPGSWSGAGVDR